MIKPTQPNAKPDPNLAGMDSPYRDLILRRRFVDFELPFPTAGFFLSALVEQTREVEALRMALDRESSPLDLLSAKLNPRGTELQKRLNGNAVVDLFCGQERPERAMVASSLLGASHYTGIDLYAQQEQGQFGALPYAIVKSDALLGVARLPTHSVSLVFIFGVEGESASSNKAYCDALSEQLKRVVKPEGIIILDSCTSWDSGMPNSLKKCTQFTRSSRASFAVRGYSDKVFSIWEIPPPSNSQ